MASTLRTISFRPAGNGAYVIFADETAPALAAHKDIINFTDPQMSASVQVEPLYNQEAPFVAALGNRSWRWNVLIKRTFADAEAAAAFRCAHAAIFPDAMDLLIKQGAQSLYLVTAILAALDPGEPGGLSTNTRYSFIAKNFTTNAP